MVDGQEQEQEQEQEQPRGHALVQDQVLAYVQARGLVQVLAYVQARGLVQVLASAQVRGHAQALVQVLVITVWLLPVSLLRYLNVVVNLLTQEGLMETIVTMKTKPGQ